MKLKELKLKSAVVLDNRQMKSVCGGYGYDDDPIYDGGYLPEVVITCGQFEGRCFKSQVFYIAGIPHRRCLATGDPKDFC
jgi:hypothetical protein